MTTQRFIVEQAPDGSHAIYSLCEKYRYLLVYKTGIANNRLAVGVFANPSTATADQPDPTLRRWRTYCRDWGFGQAAVLNVRAWRETNPKLLPPDPESYGPDNFGFILSVCSKAELLVCGWGKLGGKAGLDVLDGIKAYNPHALRLNKDGSPQHPLYLSKNLKPFPMNTKQMELSP